MTITSMNNEHIKEICKLKEKKYRDITNTYIVETLHLLKEAYKSNLLKEVIILEGEKIEFSFDNITYVSKNVMKKLTSTDSNIKFIGVVSKSKEKEIGSKILVLDRIQDPGNLGTIIRSAVAFNIDTIVLSKDTVDLYNSKTIRASEGMLFKINIISRDLLEFLPTLKDYKIIGTSVMNGKNIKETSNLTKFALVIGNEGQGISKEVMNICNDFVYINMNSKCESLNAGVAASILMYEINERCK